MYGDMTFENAGAGRAPRLHNGAENQNKAEPAPAGIQKGHSMDEIIRAVSAKTVLYRYPPSRRGILRNARETSTGRCRSPRRRSAARWRRPPYSGHMLKDPKASVTVRISGGGPLGNILAVADSDRQRARVRPETRAWTCRANRTASSTSARPLATNGTLTVIRDLNLKEPYIGSTAACER